MKKAKRIIIPIVSVLLALVLLIGLAVSVLALTNLSVIFVGSDMVDRSEGKKYDCILVLGAGVRSDGSPSDMLADRLDVAVDLYTSGVSDVIVLSGDRDDAEEYDEVTAMANYCLSVGVPEADIVRDEKGFSTYESMYNLNELDEYETVVVVTQKYHLYRAVYIAEKMGFEAVGADAATRRYRGQLYRDIREVAARTKDFFLVAVNG